MYFVDTRREDLLDCLPKGLACAEIGVATGDFSAQILARVQPSALHLIDPWVHQPREDYVRDLNNVADDDQEGRFRAVTARFAGVPAVRIHRAFSAQAAADLPDGSLDFVYVDAMHTHDAVLADLLAFAPKLKPDGLLWGHDFSSHADTRRMGFGVVGGVTEFIKRSGFEILVLNAEAFATYVLARRGAGGTRAAFLSRLVSTARFAVELPPEMAPAIHHKRVVDGQGRVMRYLPSFRLG